MKTTYTRLKKELALLLIAAMVISMVGCKKKKVGSEASVLSDANTNTSETTTEDTEESTAESSEATTSTEPNESTTETTPIETSETEPSETSDPSETTSDPTATPTDKPQNTNTPTATSTPKPTKAPKETKKADPTPTTPPTNTPTNTSTPTPIPATATPTDTPTPTPTTAPKETKKATDYKSTIQSAVKQAVADYCGWKTGFVFDDKMMSNQKARAKYATDNDILGHMDMSGTINPALEACGGSGCTYVSEKDQLQWFWTDHGGQNHYYYDDPYQCYYDYAKFLVKEHTDQLSTDDRYFYFGYGVSIKYTPWERSYGLGTVEEWYIVVYIGADSEMMYNTHFSG